MTSHIYLLSVFIIYLSFSTKTLISQAFNYFLYLQNAIISRNAKSKRKHNVFCVEKLHKKWQGRKTDQLCWLTIANIIIKLKLDQSYEPVVISRSSVGVPLLVGQ